MPSSGVSNEGVLPLLYREMVFLHWGMVDLPSVGDGAVNEERAIVLCIIGVRATTSTAGVLRL